MSCCFVRSSLSNQPNIMTEPINFKYAPKQYQKYCKSYAFGKVMLRPPAYVVSVSQVRNIFFYLYMFIETTSRSLSLLITSMSSWDIMWSAYLCTYLSLRYTHDTTPLLKEETYVVFTPSGVGHVVGNRM